MKLNALDLFVALGNKDMELVFIDNGQRFEDRFIRGAFLVTKQAAQELRGISTQFEVEWIAEERRYIAAQDDASKEFNSTERVVVGPLYSAWLTHDNTPPEVSERINAAHKQHRRALLDKYIAMLTAYRFIPMDSSIPLPLGTNAEEDEDIGFWGDDGEEITVTVELPGPVQ